MFNTPIVVGLRLGACDIDFHASPNMSHHHITISSLVVTRVPYLFLALRFLAFLYVFLAQELGVLGRWIFVIPQRLTTN
jgi:hypothetical protein